MRFAPLIGVFTLCQALPGTRDVATKRAGDLKVVLLADTNRDGKVDVTGDSDRGAGKETWTAESGALFLANIADTDRRCSSQITGRCASTLGSLFRETNAAARPPRPTIFGMSYEQWQRLPASADPKDQEKLAAIYENPDFDAEMNGYADRMREWEWASGDGALIERCHDATDDVLRNPALLAPLRTVPNPGLSATATGSVTVSDKTAASKVRVFHNKGGRWVYVGPDYVFSAQDMQAGLMLGVDGRDVRRPGSGGWDGRALVTLTVRDGDNNSTADDSVALRVAPVLTHHHGQRAEQLYGSTDGLPHREAFIQDLAAVSSRTPGIQSPVHVFNNTECSYTGGPDTWTQDFFEPGYTSIPGPDGGRPVGLRIMIRSAQSSREAGRTLFQTLRSDSVGAVQHIRSALDDDTVESMGNLETIPPHTHNGVAYPAGRAVMGSQSGDKPVMMAFLEAQEVQKPLQLDTSWLQVGHVDEFLQFLPSVKSSGQQQQQRKWTVVVDDPAAGLALLQDAQRDNHGAVKAVSRPGRESDPAAKKCTPSDTIDEVLARTDFAAYQDACAKAIQANMDILKRETGITDAEIIRLPALFWPKSKKLPAWQCEESKAKSAREVEPEEEEEEEEEEEVRVSAAAAGLERRITHEYASLWPGIVNGVVLSDSKVLAPNPWGPVVNGTDILVKAANAAYAKAGFTVEYMDDWYSQHVRTGEVHCATNTLREVGGQWW